MHGATLIQATSNSALRVQNTGAQNLLVADTSNMAVAIGNISTSATYPLQVAGNIRSAGGNLYLDSSQDIRWGDSTTYIRGVGNGGSGNLQAMVNSAQVLTANGSGQVAIGSGSAANGVLTVGTNTTTASGGIYLGSDTNLYRSGASALTTDGAMTVRGGLTAIGPSTSSGGTNGGAGSGVSGDHGGGGGGGIGGAATPSNATCNGDTGAQAVDVSGLFAVVSGLGYATTGPGGGYGCTNPSTNLANGGPASGFGSGGGGAGFYGGMGGNGLYGGGGGGAAGWTAANRIGGNGGQGVVVISPTGGTNVAQTTGTSYTVPAGITSIKIWVIGAGGGGAGATNIDSTSGGGGGGGGIAYGTFSVTPGQTVSYGLGTGGTGGTNTANGSAGSNTTATVGSITITGAGGAGGTYNDGAAAAGGSYVSGASSNAFQVQNAAGVNLIKADTNNNAIFLGSNLLGDVQGWVSDSDQIVPTPATDDIHYSRSVYDDVNNYILTIGHNSTTNTDSVYYNSGCGGDTCGAWTNLTDTMTGLPALPIRDITTYNGWVYVALRVSANSTAIYYTNNFSTWTAATDGTFGNVVPFSGAIVATNGYLYLLRASSDSNPGYNALYYTLGGGGAPTLTNITNGPVLYNYFEDSGDESISQQAVAMNNRIYVYDSYNNILAYSTQSGATLGAFSSTTPSITNYFGGALTGSPRYCSPASSNCYLHIVGGQGGTGDEVFAADVSGGAAPTSWFQTSYTLPHQIYFGGAVVSDDFMDGSDWYMYSIGGYDINTSADVYDVDSAFAPNYYSGDTDPWVTTSYPLQQLAYTTPDLQLNGAAVLNGRLYSIGGQDGANSIEENGVFGASLNTDGSVGSWSQKGTLPQTMLASATTVANGRLYVLGGYSSGVPTAAGYIGTPSTDGSLSFSSTTSLPSTMAYPVAAYTGKKIYVIGGYNAGPTTTVSYSNDLGADGKITSWSAGNALPAGRYNPGVSVANGYVYVVGGTGASGFTSSVYYAKIGSDGTLGGWITSSNPLPANVSGVSAEVVNGYLYVMGGYTSTIYYAKVNSDGSTGSWSTASNSLPYNALGPCSATANGYLYVVCGADNAAYASVQRTQVAGSLDLVGAYPADEYSTQLGSIGGTLTAGDTTVVGNLNVFGDGSFGQNVSVNGNLAVHGGLYTNTIQGDTTVTVNSDLKVKPGTNSSSAFVIQNAAGTNLLAASTANNSVVISQGNFVITGLSAPSISLSVGSNQGGTLSGATTYFYKVTALNAAGESIGSNEPSFNCSTTCTAISAPTALTATATGTAGNVSCNNTGGQGCAYQVTYTTANGETTGGSTSTRIFNVASKQISLTNIPLGPTGTTSRKIYRSTNGGAFLLDQTIANNTATTATDNVLTPAGAIPGSNTARTNTNNINVFINAVSGATSYKVYRGTSSGGENILAGSPTTSGTFTDTGSGGGGSPPATSTVGRVGIGTGAPTYQFSLLSRADTGQLASFVNTTTTDSTNTQLLRLGVGAAASSTNARFIQFYGGASTDTNGTAVGHININNNAVNYATSGADYAEWFDTTEPLAVGEIVQYATGGVGKAQAGNPSIVGVVSDTYGFTGGYQDGDETNPNRAVIGLTGQVKVKVTGDAIEPGDPVGISATVGVGQKMTGPGQIVGYAMESFSGSGNGTIKIFLNPGHYNGPTDADYIQTGGNAILNNLAVGGTASFADLNASGTVTTDNLEVTGSASINNLTVTGSATVAELEVTGSATFAGNITVGGHIITAGETPAVQAEAAAGTGATCTVTGNDTGGSLTITAGTASLADGVQCTLTFHNVFDHTPNPVATPRNKDSAQAGIFVDADTTKMTIEFANAPVAGTTYKFNYFNTQ